MSRDVNWYINIACTVIASSGTPGGKNLQVDLSGQPGHGDCSAHPVTDGDTSIGTRTGESAAGLLSKVDECAEHAGQETSFFRDDGRCDGCSIRNSANGTDRDAFND